MDTTLSPRHLFLLGAILLALTLLPGPASSSAATVGGSAAVRLAAPIPLPSSLAWGWPLEGKPQVVHPFDPPPKPWLSGHRGVDLSAPQGASVLAPDAGVVSFSGTVVNRPVLTITAANALLLSFEPVASPLKAGDIVVRGQIIGVVATPTHCDGASSGVASCLHWGVRRGEEYLDPLQFILDLRPSVLLPLLG